MAIDEDKTMLDEWDDKSLGAEMGVYVAYDGFDPKAEGEAVETAPRRAPTYPVLGDEEDFDEVPLGI